MKNSKIYYCRECGCLLDSMGKDCDTLTCCGKKMEELLPGKSDGAHEKHQPVVSYDGKNVTVTVGETGHPMTKEHLIEWIYLKTDKGRYIRYLRADEHPSFTFTLTDESPIEASAFCNKHGLWRAHF